MTRYGAHWEASFDRLEGLLDDMKEKRKRANRS
jgi:hypothetical protein